MIEIAIGLVAAIATVVGVGVAIHYGRKQTTPPSTKKPTETLKRIFP